MSKTDKDWQEWGERDPYFGVLTAEEFRKDSIDENKAAFFASGEEFINARLAKIRSHFGDFGTGQALDFGCGVGRLVIPLAHRFDQVVGVDISPAMIAEARKNCIDHELSNVEFYESDDALSKVSGSFNFVHTYIVMQHIPVGRGLRILGGLLDRVSPGGVASLHMSVHRAETFIGRVRYWAHCHVPGVVAVTNVRNGRPIGDRMMQMNNYPLGVVLGMMRARGFGDILIITSNMA